VTVHDTVEQLAALEVTIIDDHRLLADALALALGGHRIQAAVPDLGTADDLLVEVIDRNPDLVLLDLDLGGDLGDGAALVRPLVEAGLRVLIVTATHDVEARARAIEAGALGIVPKNGPFGELVRSVVSAAHGTEVLTPRARLGLLDAARRQREARLAVLAPFDRLTDREAEVLRLVARGATVAAIARRSSVSEATVRSQVRAILTKLGVRSQLEAVVAAQRAGWS
jgi:DNA-binding NarL/FixJ family response regulator